MRAVDEFIDREFELVKLEVSLLEQRIAQLENLQYRLKQLSIALWVLLLGAGVGVRDTIAPRAFFLAMGMLIPCFFLYLDTRYAVFAQNIRTRRDRITERVNSFRCEDSSPTVDRAFPILDLTGHSTDPDDPQALYRKSMLVKLTRATRMIFYGIQIILANAVLSTMLALADHQFEWLYYTTILASPFIISSLYVIRRVKKRATVDALPKGYYRPIDEHADGYRIVQLPKVASTDSTKHTSQKISGESED